MRILNEYDETFYEGRMLLGVVVDRVVQVLDDYVTEATEMICQANVRALSTHAANPSSSSSAESSARRGSSVGARLLHSRDWVMLIVRSFEDAGMLVPGTAIRVESGAPR